MSMAPSPCFHCGEPLPEVGVRRMRIAGVERALCCAGCEAAALLITGSGLEDYYRLRAEAGGNRPEEADLAAWDDAVSMAPHIHRGPHGCELTLLVSGIRCAACSWLIERALADLAGVREVRVNAATQRLMLRWDPDAVRLSVVLGRLTRLGYQPYLAGAAESAALRRERRTALKRLVVAGVGMTQAMMFAEALYFGAGAGEPATMAFFRWLGVLVAAPVVFYSGWPFLAGAWRELGARRPGMDTLVAGTVLIAFCASVFETLRGGAQVYFDSAVMFVFLLLLTRHLEQAARRRANDAVALLARAQPATARRIEHGRVVSVPAHALMPGDRLRLRPGEALAADGILESRAGAFDEAVLTGESRALSKRCGDAVLAGSHCLEATVDVLVTRTGADTVLSGIVRLVERAQAARPRVVEVADRVAAWFVLALFACAAATAAVWWQLAPERALGIALAVLAVSCPCALALAVPAAQAAAHGRLARLGVLALRPEALQALARADTVVLDKTGTLSRAQPRIVAVEPLADVPADDCAAIAAALEREAAHPLAHAFAPHAREELRAAQVRTHAGLGIEGKVGGVRYRLGTPGFAGTTGHGYDTVVLAAARGPIALAPIALAPIARFRIEDELRPDARALCDGLRAMGYDLAILSGDAPRAVQAAAQALDVAIWRARQQPEHKLAFVRARQHVGRSVAMVGDGMNDAAVLAQADVSIALGSGAALAHASADLVLIGPGLGSIPRAFELARAARRVMRQNLAWAVVYNLAALPIAAAGLLAPWAAALGMCISSLAVTLNATRLARWQAPRGAALETARLPVPPATPEAYPLRAAPPAPTRGKGVSA